MSGGKSMHKTITLQCSQITTAKIILCKHFMPRLFYKCNILTDFIWYCSIMLETFNLSSFVSIITKCNVDWCLIIHIWTAKIYCDDHSSLSSFYNRSSNMKHLLIYSSPHYFHFSWEDMNLMNWPRSQCVAS